MITLVRASQMHMVMSCAGSLFFKDLPPQEMSDAALEGTIAAEWLEKRLKGEPIGTHSSHGKPYTEDMVYYGEQVTERILEKASGTINAEEQLDWVSACGIKVQGRCDANFIGKDGKLYIDDLKYGYGIIEPEYNWQLITYAIGKVMRLGQAMDVVLRIHQPRAHHEAGTTREWSITYSELLGLKGEIDQRLTLISGGYNTLETSKSCRYCPAAAHCPAHNKAFFRGVEEVTRFVQDNIDDTELAFQLDLVNRIEELVKTRKGSLELLATTRIKEGKIIPNYVTVDNYGHRKWNDDVTAENILTLTGVDISNKVLLSPAQAEKRGFNKDMAKMFTSRPHLGTKLKRKDSTKEGNRIFGTDKPKEIK